MTKREKELLRKLSRLQSKAYNLQLDLSKLVGELDKKDIIVDENVYEGLIKLLGFQDTHCESCRRNVSLITRFYEGRKNNHGTNTKQL